VKEVDKAAREELRVQLRSTSAAAERARRNFETLQASLASRGQAVRSDVASRLAEVERLLEDARVSLEENDLATAEDYLRRVSAHLRQVAQVVGG
jgi:hypothetical protein